MVHFFFHYFLSCFCLFLITCYVVLFVLADDGDLFLWGSNRFGQLATTQAFHSSPIVLKRSLFKGEKVKSVWSGWTHIVAQTGETQSHLLYSFIMDC